MISSKNDKRVDQLALGCSIHPLNEGFAPSDEAIFIGLDNVVSRLAP